MKGNRNKNMPCGMMSELANETFFEGEKERADGKIKECLEARCARE